MCDAFSSNYIFHFNYFIYTIIIFKILFKYLIKKKQFNFIVFHAIGTTSISTKSVNFHLICQNYWIAVYIYIYKKKL